MLVVGNSPAGKTLRKDIKSYDTFHKYEYEKTIDLVLSRLNAETGGNYIYNVDSWNDSASCHSISGGEIKASVVPSIIKESKVVKNEVSLILLDRLRPDSGAPEHITAVSWKFDPLRSCFVSYSVSWLLRKCLGLCCLQLHSLIT